MAEQLSEAVKKLTSQFYSTRDESLGMRKEPLANVTNLNSIQAIADEDSAIAVR